MSFTIKNYVMCRMCLAENGDFTNVFESFVPSDILIKINDVIRYCVSVQVSEEDGLPEKICTQCLNNMKNMYLFKQLCERSDATLRGHLLSMQKLGLGIKQEPLAEIHQDFSGINADVFIVKDQPYEVKTEFCEDLLQEESAETSSNNPVDSNVFLNEINSQEEAKIYYEEDKLEDNRDPLLLCDDVEQPKIKRKEKVMVNKPKYWRYKCKMCDSRFAKQTFYNRHMDANHSTCSDCGKIFKTISLMRSHLAQEHFQYKCHICPERFQHPIACFKHVAIHGKFECETCQKGFRTMQNLKKHKIFHKARPHRCHECGRSFATADSLKVHQKFHAGTKSFECKVCSTRFSKYQQLQYHKRSHHSEKRYECFDCGYRFFDKSVLIKHFRTHTGERPYKCELCGSTFTQKGSMQKHKKTIHIR